MIDHMSLPVSDYARAKAFYLKALAPLGYGIAMEVAPEESGGTLVGEFEAHDAAPVPRASAVDQWAASFANVPGARSRNHRMHAAHQITMNPAAS